MTAEDRFYRNIGEIMRGAHAAGPAAHHAAVEFVFACCDAWINAAAQCQSPIEALLLSEFLFAFDGAGWVQWDDAPDAFPVPTDMPLALFQMQAGVGPYRADFLFTCHSGGKTRRVVVECDGHDFHERTKQQAQRDKARDRYMVTEGITVLRFTGSEIHRDPRACRKQVEAVLGRFLFGAGEQP